MDDEVLEVVQQLMAWHSNRVDQLNIFVNQDAEKIRIGDHVTIDNPDVIKGIRIGVQVSLELLGKLPISLNQTSEEDDYEEHDQ